MSRRSPFAFLLCALFCALLEKKVFARPVEFSKVIIARNIRTGELHVRNLTEIREPDSIGRVRLFVTRLKTPNGKGDEIDVFHVRIRWTEPDQWNDNFNDSHRSYEILCELEDEDTGETRNLLQLRVSDGFNGYDERFRFPLDSHYQLRCQVRPRNSEDLTTEWTSSKSVDIFDLKPFNV
ncbi:hypothetical protein QR680_016593 [Steinernema hermaphroditum]|uniref:PLAT domain-containing protein n=1 Tax=Steinernema hermaphroditum TaxID=289476 RepID=A0AA39HCT4_9BILA|nr:hypothetical protein QR680_016593 [Steinernema hermaphroditum]